MKRTTWKWIAAIMMLMTCLAVFSVTPTSARAGTIDVGEHTYTLFTGLAADGCSVADSGDESENYLKLLDGRRTTKWRVERPDYTDWEKVYVDFHTAYSFVVKGYILTTGNGSDNTSSAHNPKGWKLWGKKNADDPESDWSVIAVETNCTSLQYGTKDELFDLENNTEGYQYYRLEITAVVGVARLDNYTMELGELQLFGHADQSSLRNLANATFSGLQDYYYYDNGGEIPIGNYAVLNADRGVLTPGRDFTATLNGTDVTNIASPTVTDEGDYTLTVTGTGNENSGYYGSKTFTFSVNVENTEEHGTETEGSIYLPLRTVYSFSLSQQIYTAAELKTRGYITAIQLKSNSPNLSHTIPGIRIYMKTTDINGFSRTGDDIVPVSESDRVYSGDLVIPAGGWFSIPLDTPFCYDGTGNLLICFYDPTSGGNNGKDISFSCTSTENYMAIAYYSSNYFDPVTRTGNSTLVTQLQQRNNIRFTSRATSTALRFPTGLSSTLNGTSATLSWTENGIAEQWEICLDDDEINTIVVTENPYTVSNLTAEKTYSVKVRSVIGETRSTWSDSIYIYPTEKQQIGSGTKITATLPTREYCSFSLTQQIYTTAELGEAGSIQSVAFFSRDDTETRNLKVYMTGTGKSRFSDGNDWVLFDDEDLVYSGSVTFTQNTWTTIPFSRPFSYDGIHNAVLIVYDLTDCANSLRTFSAYDANDQSMYTYGSYALDLSDPEPGYVEGQKNQIRIVKGQMTGITRPYDVTVKCDATTADVSWTSNASAWDIDVDGTVTENVTSPYTLTGLEYNTVYTVKVRARSGEEVSGWSAAVSFTTPPERKKVSYVDADGNTKSVTATVLYGTETELVSEWYAVCTDISYDHTIYLDGDARIILADGATFRSDITGNNLYSDGCISYSYGGSSLSVYGQASGTGAMKLSGDYGGIRTGSLHVFGGQVTVSCEQSFGITVYELNIRGGNVQVTANEGITFYEAANLGWRTTGDRIYASSYCKYHDAKYVTVAAGQYLYNGTEVLSGSISDLSLLNGKTLQPALKITLPEGFIAGGKHVFSRSDGVYALPGAKVKLTAEKGYVFSSVSYTPAGGTATDLNESDGSWSFTVADKDVTVNATRAIFYPVTVTNGKGSGEYTEGASVTITANDPETGRKFKAWTGADGLTFTSGSAASATATFTMPAKAVTVTATYEDASAAPGPGQNDDNNDNNNDGNNDGNNNDDNNDGNNDNNNDGNGGDQGNPDSGDNNDGQGDPSESPAPETWTITFDAHGGTGEMAPVTVVKGEKYKLPACGFTAPANRVFDTWDKGLPGTTIEIAADTVITARWAVVLPEALNMMPPTLVSTGKTSLRLSWNQIPHAEGYDVFVSSCGGNHFSLYQSLAGADVLSCRITGLKKGKCYKVYVRGWMTEDGEKTYINSIGFRAHALAGGYNNKVANAGKVIPDKTKVTLEPGKSTTVEVKLQPVKAGRKVLSHGKGIRWYSSNPAVAKVNDKGKITAKGEGSCVIYAVACNGVRGQIKVTVENPTIVNGGKYRLNSKKTAAIFIGPEKKDAASLKIENSITVNGESYPVTEIAEGACSGLKKLESLTIGENVKKIGAKAFFKCGKLAQITVKTKLLTMKNVGAGCFSNIFQKAAFRVPKKMIAKYREWFIRVGKAPATATFGK